MDEGSLGEMTCCSKGGALLNILATRLAVKLRRKLPDNALAVGILGSGFELSECVVRELQLPHQKLCACPVYWPPKSQSFDAPETREVIGAVSGCTDVIYFDPQAVKRTGSSIESLMSHVQNVKLNCMREAVNKKMSLADANWSETAVCIICCAHAPAAVIEVAVQVSKIKNARQVVLAIPFMSSEIRKQTTNRIDTFVTLKEFEKGSAATRYSEGLSGLDGPGIMAELAQFDRESAC